MILLNKTKNALYIQQEIFKHLHIINSDAKLTKQQINNIWTEYKLLLLFAKDINKEYNIKELKRSIKQ